MSGIKSDKWIRAQCEQPIGHVHVTATDGEGKPLKFVEPVYSSQSYDTFVSGPAKDEVLRKLVKRGIIPTELHADSCEFQRHFHSDNFKPMIEPFAPTQVRTNERSATKDEIIALMGCNTEEEALAALSAQNPLIKRVRHDPLLGIQVHEKTISHGTSSYGYDIRCGNEFKIFTNVNSAIIDPKNFDDKSFVDYVATPERPYAIIPPNSFALARTMEYFRIPRNVLTVCLGKSTYARCGIIVNVTPFEPEWEGYVTLEFSNTTPLPAKIYAGEGCAQVLFFESDEDCETSYKDRNGKYQGQSPTPVTPKV